MCSYDPGLITQLGELMLHVGASVTLNQNLASTGRSAGAEAAFQACRDYRYFIIAFRGEPADYSGRFTCAAFLFKDYIKASL